MASQLENLMLLLGSSPEPWVLRFQGKIGGTIASPKARVQFIHPKKLSPFPERLKLPYPDEEILSGYEEDVSFIQDGFTTWVQADFNTILERHVVDVREALAEYREASVRRHDTSAQQYYFDSSVPNRSSVQKRLSIYNWNPGPRRGKEGAIENKLQGNGTLSPCKKRMSMLTTSFSRVGST